MFSDHEKCCSDCQRRKKLTILAGLASYVRGLPELGPLAQTKGASSVHADRLPTPEYELEKQRRLSQSKRKDPSGVKPVIKAERAVKLEMLGRMVRG